MHNMIFVAFTSYSMTKTSTRKAKDCNKKASTGNPRKWTLVSQWEKEETDSEMHLRKKEEKKTKEKKKSDRAIKKLKKDGKVQPITGYLICKEEKEDDWIGSKKNKFERNRTRRRNAPKSSPPLSDVTVSLPIRNELYSDESDEEDDYLEDILNFRPFCNGLNQPIVRSTRKL